MEIILLLVGFLASVFGSICGLGGGVIIKPVLDSFAFASADTVSFLSGITVLCMSAYNIIKTIISKDNLNLKTNLPLGFGAAIGGILGKELFNIIKHSSSNPSFVGNVQAISLGVFTFLTLIYTINSHKIEKRNVESKIMCIFLGLVLGLMSSFMGIGGGPFNLLVLSYFFSMSTKKAATSSLFIILLSQIFSLLTTIITHTIPEYKISWLLVMSISGILGGIVGKYFNKKLNEHTIHNLYLIFLILIILISIYNSF